MIQNESLILEKLLAFRNEMRDKAAHGGDWEDFTLRVFRFQAECNVPFGKFVQLRGVDPNEVRSMEYIPFLPVEFFQTHRISVFPAALPNEKVFLSSGTSGQLRSRHIVDDSTWYDDMAVKGFDSTSGPLEGTVFFGLLPGYLERGQSSLVHMVRNSMKYVSWKDYKVIAADLKGIYKSVTEEQALLALEEFAEHWDDKYPQISKSWRAHWDNLNTLFNYPEDIRRAIYTTNAIESLNSVIRKAVKKRKLFPSDESAKKVVYLAIQQASKKWTMPIRNWKAALNRFMIDFEDRLTNYI